MLADPEESCTGPLVAREGDAPQPTRMRAKAGLGVATVSAMLVAGTCAVMRAPHARAVEQMDEHGIISAATSHKCRWNSKGEGTYCRVDPEDASWTGDGTTIHHLNVKSLQECQNLCEKESGCRGIEFHHGFSNHCELWVRPIGHYVKQESGWHQDLAGMYECLTYDCEAKDACNAQVFHWCEASAPDCHVVVPDASHIASNLFPNKCGHEAEFEYALHFHNDKHEEVTVEADTCDPNVTLFDSTISMFRPTGDQCEHVACDDDRHSACSAATCVEGDEFAQNSHCTPEQWIKCCSRRQATVPADGQVVIVVSSYHEKLHRFKADQPPGFKLRVRLLS